MIELFKKSILKGAGLFLGFVGTALFAYTVSGTIKTWTTGDTLTATDLNTTVQSLVTAVQNARQVGSLVFRGTTGSPTVSYEGFLVSQGAPSTTESAVPRWVAVREGMVKSVRVTPLDPVNTCTGNSTLTLRKNGADTALVLVVPGGSRAAVTTVTAISYVATDILNWQYNCGAGMSTPPNIHISFEF